MSIGTLYEFSTPKTRSILPRSLVEYFKLDVKFESTEDAAFIENFPLKKVPAFISADGTPLTESIAINLYREYLQIYSNWQIDMMNFF